MKADSDAAAAENAESEQTRMLFLELPLRVYLIRWGNRGGSRIGLWIDTSSVRVLFAGLSASTFPQCPMTG